MSRCKNKKLKPCTEYQVRNPVTCRCNKIKVMNSSRKRKIHVDKPRCENKKLKPCTESQVRNLVTCRCNKIKYSTRKRI